MKHVKILGLAAVAAMALMATVGVGTAFAGAQVCSTNTSPCTGTLYGSGTKISSQLKSGTHATLTSSITNVTCKKSTVGGQLSNNEGHGTISSFTFSDCTDSSGNKCTVNAVNLSYTATATNNTDALDVTEGPGGGPPGANVQCPFVNCTFTVNSITLGVTGGNPAIISAKNEPLEREGGFCPSEAFWHAEYEVTSPKPLFLV